MPTKRNTTELSCKIKYYITYEFGKSKIKKTFHEQNPLEARCKVAHYIEHLKTLYRYGHDIGLFKEQYEGCGCVLDIHVLCKEVNRKDGFLICQTMFPYIDKYTPASDKDFFYAIIENSNQKIKLHYLEPDPFWYNLEREYLLYKKYHYDTGGEPIQVGVLGGKGRPFTILDLDTIHNILLIIPFENYPTVLVDGIMKGKNKYILLYNHKEIRQDNSLIKRLTSGHYLLLSISPFGITEKLERVNIGKNNLNYRYRVNQEYISPKYITPIEEFTI